MKCKKCKREIQENSIFCNWCGAKQIKDGIGVKIPKPKKTKDGYTAQIMADGVRQYISGKTIAEYEKNVAAFKAGDAAARSNETLKTICQNYINYCKENGRSPSTTGGYESIVANRFKNHMDKKVCGIAWQQMIDEEREKHSGKTVCNAWSLVSSSLKYAKLNVPEIRLPAKEEYDGDFLDHKQVITFLKAIRGNRSETAALLAMHSLRASELFHIEAEKISEKGISVEGATVRARGQGKIDKDTNKTKLSRRYIPVIIPRLLEILPESGKAVTVTERQAYLDITKVCRENGLPVCSLHDLRRTFASLAAYLKWHEESICAVGGWKPGSPIVHKIYIKCSKTETDEDAALMKDYLKIT